MQDMLMALDHPDRFVEHLAVRQWVPLEVDLEFRGFVGPNGRLNALSQYNHLAFFPRLLPLREALTAAISSFFDESVGPALSAEYPSGYVVDFGVVFADDNGGTQGSVVDTAAAATTDDDDDDCELARDGGGATTTTTPCELVAKVWVIEINPFLSTTDGCLFDWSRDAHLLSGALQQPETPLELRLTEAPKAGAAAMLHPAWRAACGV
jgi:hypothetical protein